MMSKRHDQQTLRDYRTRYDYPGSGVGMTVQRQPIMSVGRLSLGIRVVRTISHEGSGRYRVQEITYDGTEMGHEVFDAYEIDGLTTVGDGTRVVAYPTADGRTYVFFRRGAVRTFDGICRIDAANPAVPDPNTWAAMVDNTVGGGIFGVILPDANTMECLLLHLAAPINIPNAKIELYIHLQHRIEWNLNGWAAGNFRYDYDIELITQDFDYGNTGAVAPPRNTWNTRPTTAAAINRRIDESTALANGQTHLGEWYNEFITDHGSVRHADPLTPAAPAIVYGVQITPVDWYQNHFGRVFAAGVGWEAGKTEFWVLIAYSHILL